MDDKQSQRIARILGIKECEDVFDEALDVTEETLEVYFQYLKKKVKYPRKRIFESKSNTLD